MQSNSAAIHEKEVQAAYRRLFVDNEDGRLVLQDLACLANILSSGFTGNSTTFYNCGRKDFFFNILERIKGCKLSEIGPQETLSVYESIYGGMI